MPLPAELFSKQTKSCLLCTKLYLGCKAHWSRPRDSEAALESRRKTLCITTSICILYTTSDIFCLTCTYCIQTVAPHSTRPAARFQHWSCHRCRPALHGLRRHWQSKPIGIKMVYPNPCKEKKSWPQLFQLRMALNLHLPGL